ncbi:MAG: OprD family porin [Gammaproteobacteria bacterium]|nr:OprD family porin [Gammaproteobacteria bacterium]MBU1459109.1 OprD family porin [Gammaproteobacteria bacterium]MBU1772792.1 OprD family porin [Gammaproteobacteria bacterium]MBU2371309.1 OprD family porin [Gammaproteobacteria bacterium]HAW22489.1 outer membrane porin, OprD family [Pseudomonas sp.]
MQVMKWSVIAMAVAAGTSQMAFASSQSESEGFVEGSSLTILNRNLYMNRDFRDNGAGGTPAVNGQSYREEWGHGFIGTFESGFTQGTVGVGVDAIGLLGVKLDTGRGRQGNGIFPAVQGDEHVADDYSQAGAAVKFRVSNTVLKYGTQFVALPVFSTDDSRLLPETAEGGLISSSEIEGLELNAGRFTALSAQRESSHDALGLDEIIFVGGTYAFSDNVSTSLYYSDLEDAFEKYYGNVNYNMDLGSEQSLAFDFNIYQSEYESEYVGTANDEDNTIWSLAGTYAFDAHKFTVAYQQSHGGVDGVGYIYGDDGGGTVWLANSVQYSDFNGEDEKSWQARYDINMASYGVPGLSFMTRYVSGYDISTPTGTGEEREWDVEAKYVVQDGAAKDLSLRLRHAKYWSDSDYAPVNGTDLTDLRLIVEYPLSIL